MLGFKELYTVQLILKKKRFQSYTVKLAAVLCGRINPQRAVAYFSLRAKQVTGVLCDFIEIKMRNDGEN